MQPAQRIVTLPAGMAGRFADLEGREAPLWHATHDPGRPLGSGAGTVHALLSAWRQEGGSLEAWLRTNRRIIVHAGGQSRRLPAYAAVGKALMPIPVLRGSDGQRPDQSLLDLQVEFCDRLLERAAPSARAAIVSGDAHLLLRRLPASLPDADVVVLGLPVEPETASRHGVALVPRRGSRLLHSFLQKPPVAEILRLELEHDCLLDTGLWLLSERAIHALMAKCAEGEPASARLREYDLYGEFGPALGLEPARPDPLVSPLSAAVAPLEGAFLHFGTSAQMVESAARLQEQARMALRPSGPRHPRLHHVQNVEFAPRPGLPTDSMVWLENCRLGEGWELEGDSIVTGVPAGLPGLRLPKGVCLDVVPVAGGWCLRPYGLNDAFRGALASPDIEFLGRPLAEWMAERGLSASDLGGEACDIQAAPLFPTAADPGEEAGQLLRWMISEPDKGQARQDYLASPRLSASDLLEKTDVVRLYRQRARFAVSGLEAMQKNHANSVFYSLDLERAAQVLHAGDPDFMPVELPPQAPELDRMRACMFRASLMRLRGDADWEREEKRAFDVLRTSIIESLPETPTPRFEPAPDQIVWGRSPLRFDLAGGWTDTPPYCQLNGGRVLNMAVDLNGQPPVQVFIRRSEDPSVLLRSIDLGTERRFHTFEELAGGLTDLSEFSLAQAALVLAGIAVPERGPTLRKALEDLGGGLEISLLAAVPKGSGLGTSSILAATILASLSEFAGLGWSQWEVTHRTLALEQMLGTGGGWQDQAGGCLPGVKELRSEPGLIQRAESRWLSERIFGSDHANRVLLLYYTGITRVAKSVLKEIVRGMFLNSGRRLDTLRLIGENVPRAVDAIQKADVAALGEAVRQSWELNQALDSGTNPPSVQAILSQVDDWLTGAKLLGAGGGGFLFMTAKDEEAACRIRAALAANPPSARARFFDFAVSATGLQVSRS